jgi:hypothetical protein
MNLTSKMNLFDILGMNRRYRHDDGHHRATGAQDLKIIIISKL